MLVLDWIVLVATLVFIVIYGIWKGRGNKDMKGYLLANKTMPWYAVGLSIIATQASAITFLSAPGQAFSDGMRFVQFYFGLPLAMVVLSVTAVPIYHKLNVYTAYEYLENRFDLKTRALAAFLFLIQRGVSTGLTIYAPAIILSSLLGWNTNLTSVIIGVLVLLYTVFGGTKAVSYTQLGQVTIILCGMLTAFFMIVYLLPKDISFLEAVKVAGKTGKMNVIDLKFNPNSQYNIWSGLIGGFFLQMSYFGTDQSQVGRYLAGSSIGQSRLGLLFNGIIKVPMQFCILFIGIVLFVFYQFVMPPIIFNRVETNKILSSPYAGEYKALEERQKAVFDQKQLHVRQLVDAMRQEDEGQISVAQQQLQQSLAQDTAIRSAAIRIMKQNDEKAEVNDTNYVFLNFVTTYLPAGVVGLLIAVVFSASMASSASAFNSLTSTTIVDVYKRLFRSKENEAHYLLMSKLITIGWGIFCIVVALYAGKMGNLLEAVNRLGSLFYGAILGIFVCAFYFKNIKGAATFYAALLTEAIIFALFYFTEIAFLWYNVIGCLLVIVLGLFFTMVLPRQTPAQAIAGSKK
ncbi:sodium:solute symporter [Rhodocytophaga aerolata]|uniref:Sodium:solute symporter n=1 Tax=Rhodocytophaga aerolata TaxID=455078 RepID=A0ABT8R3U5_9BACT|nr:sodium:solute symporter [Rhodocytophaga aerolata]MDO1445422.1 sodium:solute symporter [Rhodocytophaga aerolata]